MMVTMEMEIFKEWWPLIIAAIGGIVWLVRLEGKMNTHQSNCSERHSLDSEEARETKKSFDKLFDLVREVREDVKYLKGRQDGMQ